MAKKQTRQVVENAPVDDLVAAACSLSWKNLTTTRETDYGQISFDFVAINHLAELTGNSTPTDVVPEEVAILAAHTDVLKEAETLLGERVIMTNS